MSILSGLSQIIAGYPGGYRSHLRGTQRKKEPPPFQQSTDPRDRRSRIPPLGHREYWYPALPARDVGWKKPVVLRMLGTDLCFFRNEQGEVKALWDVCPHRSVYLSNGDCFYKGFVTCPYHGATFDGDGNCVAFLTEGPDSQAVGRMKARAYPTVTLHGMVFVWMGEGEPVDPKEDIPPEMFEEHNIFRPSFYMIPCNWVLCLENTNDAHNAFFTHRNAFRVLFRNKMGGRPRTPIGYRTKIFDNHTVHYGTRGGNEDEVPTDKYYYDENGKIAYQMYYPGVKGVWPLHRWRLLWAWLPEWQDRRKRRNKKGNFDPNRIARKKASRWEGTCLPGISLGGVRDNDRFRSSRWPVPVERDLTRMVYLNVERYSSPPALWTRLWSSVTWPYRNWSLNFNFRNQDVWAEQYGNYDAPEYLLSTDSVVVAMRKLFTENARGVQRPEAEAAVEEVGDTMVQEGDRKALEVLSNGKSVHADEIRVKLAGAESEHRFVMKPSADADDQRQEELVERR